MRIVSHTTLIVGTPGDQEEIPPGKPVDVEDKEAQRLISLGLAAKHGRGNAREPQQASKPQPEKEIPPSSDPAEGSEAE